MEGVTLILEISVAVLIAAVIISLLYTQFSTATTEYKHASNEIIDTTSKFDMVLLKQYNNTIVNGYDVRYAIKHMGTSKDSKVGAVMGNRPDDFFVCVGFNSVPGGEIPRKFGNATIEFIIPNRYQDLNNFNIKTQGNTQYLDAFYIAPESTFRAYLLIEGSDSEITELRNLNLQRSLEDNVESDDVVGIYFKEN